MLGVVSPQKTGIFSCDNNMLYSPMKRSLLIWAHNKLSFVAKNRTNNASEMVWQIIG